MKKPMPFVTKLEPGKTTPNS